MGLPSAGCGRGVMGRRPRGLALLCGLREIQTPLWAPVSILSPRAQRPPSFCHRDVSVITEGPRSRILTVRPSPSSFHLVLTAAPPEACCYPPPHPA